MGFATKDLSRTLIGPAAARGFTTPWEPSLNIDAGGDVIGFCALVAAYQWRISDPSEFKDSPRRLLDLADANSPKLRASLPLGAADDA